MAFSVATGGVAAGVSLFPHPATIRMSVEAMRERLIVRVGTLDIMVLLSQAESCDSSKPGSVVR
jgi:hypothetical protein